MDDIVIKDGIENMDFKKVTKMLSNAFWSKGIELSEVMQGAENSALIVGAFEQDGSQIGYARVISDKTRFAYITDVYIEEYFRKKGIGQKIINYILNHKELKDVYQWLLITKDAHEVYKKIGFNVTSRPLDYLEIRKERTR
ncbi:GNAT family N-acetyltransferase [Clostridium sp.]|uniref:GNAT family N-acetyltransferase n=1 Tax=Clostridium sp. TaxID=1506 RepID=UPI002850E1C3|nr:GNAT family N-acetyltransferase [Clostridium sp.]MDR3596743.1 GNAT family N-acetyltransferase [Clostridium sp.]